MSRLVILALCAQACLIQVVFSQQCGCNQICYGSPGLIELGGIEKINLLGAPSASISYSAPSISLSAPGYASASCGDQISYGKSGVVLTGISSSSSSSSSKSGSSYSSSASYGGSGTGQVGVSGDIGASGQTVVVGSVPVLGSVEICGKVPATGSVSISGQCGCGCKA